MSPDEVFILRFWLEEGGPQDQLRWRAQVSSVSTQERQFADGVYSALALIVQRLRAALLKEKERPQ